MYFILLFGKDPYDNLFSWQKQPEEDDNKKVIIPLVIGKYT